MECWQKRRWGPPLAHSTRLLLSSSRDFVPANRTWQFSFSIFQCTRHSHRCSHNFIRSIALSVLIEGILALALTWTSGSPFCLSWQFWCSLIDKRTLITLSKPNEMEAKRIFLFDAKFMECFKSVLVCRQMVSFRVPSPKRTHAVDFEQSVEYWTSGNGRDLFSMVSELDLQPHRWISVIPIRWMKECNGKEEWDRIRTENLFVISFNREKIRRALLAHFCLTSFPLKSRIAPKRYLVGPLIASDFRDFISRRILFCFGWFRRKYFCEWSSWLCLDASLGVLGNLIFLKFLIKFFFHSFPRWDDGRKED